MGEKGFAHLIIFLLVLGLLAFLILKPTSTTKQTLVNPQTQQSQKETVAPQVDTKDLEKYLTVEASLLGVSDNVSLYFKDLNQNQEVSIEPTKSWIPASTIKTFVVLEAFRQRSLGLINFDQTVTISADNVVPTELETDEFPKLREGTVATIRQLVEAMIIQSDNTAYNTLLDILDRRNINLALKNIGLTETVVGEKLNLDDNQFQTDLQVPGRQPNTTTVKDLGTFFDLLYNHQIANSDEILSIFKRQKLNNMIPALLPQGIEVAHKTGDWAPIYHDGGVVYKPSEPYILTVFTNSDDPAVVAKLSRVAYFQNADSVGQPLSLNYVSPSISNPTTSLAESNDQVLGEQTTDSNSKFPTITAQDLGITSKDIFTTSADANSFQGALITPGSFLYNIKQVVLNLSVQGASTKKAKAEALVSLSKSRLAEVKTELKSGNVAQADQLLSESENYLKQATSLAQNDPDNKDLLLVEVKQANDLHYAVLGSNAEAVPTTQKKQFIDDVYNFIQKNKQEVKAPVNASVIANPVQQKPAVATISQISNNTATLKFDDGSTKQMLLTDDTKVRNFEETAYHDKNSLSTGDKVAVIGLTNSQSEIIPQFILTNVPKELPNTHQGTVIEINPDNSTLKILDQKGNEELIKVSNSTVVKSKDTGVSLAGITAGSQVTIFGVTQTASSPSQQGGIGGFLTNLPFFNQSTPSANTPVSSTNPSPTSGSTSPYPSTSANLVRSPLPSGSFIPFGSAPPTNLARPTPGGSAAVSANGGITPKNGLSTPQAPTLPKSSLAQTATPPQSSKKVIELRATSITVTVNSSGKNETQHSQPGKQSAPAKSAPQSKPAQSSNKTSKH